MPNKKNAGNGDTTPAQSTTNQRIDNPIIHHISEVIAGLDIGYGKVKAIRCATPGEETDKIEIFPSFYGLAHSIKFQAEKIYQSHKGDQFADNDGKWWVGNLAVDQLSEAELISVFGRDNANEQRIRLAKAALGKLLPGQKDGDVIHITLVTGLPVDHMDDKSTLKEALQGQHTIRNDQTHFIANIGRVIVMPQPYGTIYSQSLTVEGKQRPSDVFPWKRVGVVDLGQYTIDATLDDGGNYRGRESGSEESGIHLAYSRIAELYEEQYKEKPHPSLVEQILRTGKANVFGEAINFEDEVREALEPVRAATMKLMRRLWKRGASVDVIFLSGGGAPLVEDVVKAEFKQAQTLTDSQLANARGYLNYAMWDIRN